MQTEELISSALIFCGSHTLQTETLIDIDEASVFGLKSAKVRYWDQMFTINDIQTKVTTFCQ